MPAEPPIKRAVAFVDGQNLFYAAKKAFGYKFPNYDPKALAQHVAQGGNWTLSQTFFYTGIPDATDNAFWNHFWMAKLAVMGTRGVKTFSRSLRYRNQTVPLPAAVPQQFSSAKRRALMCGWLLTSSEWRERSNMMWR